MFSRSLSRTHTLRRALFCSKSCALASYSPIRVVFRFLWLLNRFHTDLYSSTASSKKIQFFLFRKNQGSPEFFWQFVLFSFERLFSPRSTCDKFNWSLCINRELMLFLLRSDRGGSAIVSSYKRYAGTIRTQSTWYVNKILIRLTHTHGQNNTIQTFGKT